MRDPQPPAAAKTDGEASRPHYADHRQRLRQRFVKSGAEGLHDYELLELLVAYAIPRRDVKPLAKSLLERFGTVAGVLDASPRELAGVNGMGEYSATLMQLTKALCAAYLGDSLRARQALSSATEAVDFARIHLAGRPHEAVMALHLDAMNRLIDHRIVTEGTIDSVVAYPRRILEQAMAANAAGLILVHNHPSGNCNPSPDDDRLTKSLFEAAKALDIILLDHLIVGRDGYYSFAEHRRLPE